MTIDRKPVEQVAQVIVDDLRRVAKVSRSEFGYDPETGCVDYCGTLRPIEIAQAILAAHRLSSPDIGALVEAAEALAFAEASYRQAHDLYGDGSAQAGREWDLMRRAGNNLRAALRPYRPTPSGETLEDGR